MAKTIFIGVCGVAHKVKKVYVGVDGVARKVKKAFIGVNGVARMCYSSAPDDPAYTGSYNVVTSGNYRYMYLKTSGTLTIKDAGTYDIFVVGGGASGGAIARDGSYGAGGGGSGYTNTWKNVALSANAVGNVTIGSGGTGQLATWSMGSTGAFVAGGTSSIIVGGTTYPAAGGKSTASIYRRDGTDGGTGGSTAFKDGTSDGANGLAYSSYVAGIGQGRSTRAFGDATNTLYGGGGAGSPYSSVTGSVVYSVGGAGGGGNGAFGYYVRSTPTGGSGTPNTGGGGGGADHSSDTDWSGDSRAGSGGSGLVIIRWAIA